MADGTLRISFDIEPNHAQDAFRLFAAPGTPAAIAALQVGYAAIQVGGETPPHTKKPKGGALAKLAGMWCNDLDFYKWVSSTTHNGIYWPCVNGTEAVQFIYEICGIESRSELDHNQEAAERFHGLIRGPFIKYMQARGTTA